tara:strand:- start:6176 stop:6598 length:423 start_codon:yes stop_codon:yes gene_type:complete
MAAVNFPSNLAPSSRSFTAGEYPQTVFEAQNGAKSVIRYGNKVVNAKLTLGFTNISDENVMSILYNYKDVNSEWKYITFSKTKGLQGIEHNGLANTVIAGTSNYMESGLRWRYDGPPNVTSVQPGINNVSCKFVACLDGD